MGATGTASGGGARAPCARAPLVDRLTFRDLWISRSIDDSVLVSLSLVVANELFPLMS